MASLKELPRKKKKILLMGPVGTGKTALGLTLGEKAQILDLDDGLETGRCLDDAFKPKRLMVDVIQVLEDRTGVSTQFMRAKAKILTNVNKAIKGEYKFEYFVIDSFTALVESAVNGIMSNSGMFGQSPEIQHWGAAFVEVKNVLLLLRMMPTTVVLIAHEQIKEVNKINEILIATPGTRMPNEVPRFFDEFWRLELKNIGGRIARILRTKGTPTLRIRSRSNLPDSLDTKVGFPAIMNLMYEQGCDKPKGATT